MIGVRLAFSSHRLSHRHATASLCGTPLGPAQSLNPHGATQQVSQPSHLTTSHSSLFAFRSALNIRGV